MWEKIDVWKKFDETTLACYRIYRNIDTDLFFVQSLDFIRSTEDEELAKSRGLELFLESSPEFRSPGFKSITDAIAAFDEDFRD